MENALTVSDPVHIGDDELVIADSTEERERKRELDTRVRRAGHHPFVEEQLPLDAPADRGSAASMISEASRHIGYREGPQNDTIFNRWLGPIPGCPRDGFGYPWCHSFVSYCLWHSDNVAAGQRPRAAFKALRGSERRVSIAGLTTRSSATSSTTEPTAERTSSS